MPIDWSNSALGASIKDLQHARDLSNRFGNSILKDLFVNITDRESADSEFGRLSYLGFICALRIQSGDYPPIRDSGKMIC